MIFNSFVGTIYRSEKDSAGVYVLTNFILCITLSASYFYTPYVPLPYIVGMISISRNENFLFQDTSLKIKIQMTAAAGLSYVLTMIGFLKLDILIRDNLVVSGENLN